MTRTRKDVTRLTATRDWPATLKAYEKAVGLLRKADPPSGPPTKPISWGYLAALHGRIRPDGRVDRTVSAWNNCQHGSWFFLPWHRMYLMAFEAIVQHVLGDTTWSLPYWYSLDPDDPTKSVLPAAFRDSSATNNLYTRHRSHLANGGHRLPATLTSDVTTALEAGQFSTDNGTTSFGSGKRARPSFDGHENGLLEDVPHGSVHMLVGDDFDSAGNPTSSGWMGSLYQAALDPIFWLHHANIDRLWEVWLRADPSHKNPGAANSAWLRTSFSFPKPGGRTVSWKVGDVLTVDGLGYTYEDLSAPSTVQPAAVPGGQFAPQREVVLATGEPRQSQTIGAVADVLMTNAEPTKVAMSATTAADDAATSPERYYLRLERITGTAAAPVYEVYLDVPANDEPTDHPELLAGRIATFGLAEASRPRGPGLTKVLEITAVRARLIADGRWDPAQLHVSFRPLVAEAPGAAEATDAQPRPADLRVAHLAVVTA
jgi:tyrosinase